MIMLPNGCKCSDLNVFPSNWKAPNASLKKNWYITYRFYDPAILKNGKVKPKLVMIKGMNDYKTLAERREITKQLLENEIDLLKNKGYNPQTGTSFVADDIEYEIDPNTPFSKALDLAIQVKECGVDTRKDITNTINRLKISLVQLRFDTIPISEVKKRHIRLALDNCEKVNDTWTANSFNNYRKYLSLLFKELCELEAVEVNPVLSISKKATVKKIRKTLSLEQRKEVDKHLHANHYNFWRFMHIFFHSGSRETEMLALKGKDIELDKQRFKVTIQKGKSKREVYKTIKDIALPLWVEAMADCGPEQILFSKFLQPGEFSIANNQISRRWRTHVKKRLGIDADFYSLKHSNTSEIVDLLSDQDAANMNGHTSTAMVIDIYDTKRSERQHSRIKKVANSFT